MTINKKTFYNENHQRDLNGRIIKRDYSTFEAVECSLCHKPIKGVTSFSKHGKPHFVYAKGYRGAPLKIITDLGNIDYCQDCHIQLETSRIILTNNFKK